MGKLLDIRTETLGRFFEILKDKKPSIADIMESEDYDAYVEQTQLFYKEEVTPYFHITREEWLEWWMLTEEEYNLLREVLGDE